MEFLNNFALFGIQWILWLVLTIVFFIGVFSESEENGFIVFGAFVILLILYAIWGSTDLSAVFKPIYITYYIGIGIIFSLIKTFFYGVNKKRHSRKAKDHVVRWILNWPMSLVFLLVGDIGTLFIKLTGELYDAIENAGKTFKL